MYSVCILIYVSMYQCIYVCMYLYSYPSTHGISGLAAGGACEQFEVCLTITIKWTQRYTPRPWSSDCADALGSPDRLNIQMHSEIMIEWVWRSTWRACSCYLGDRNRASLEIHLEAIDWTSLEMHLVAVIERVWRCTWRPRSSEPRDALWGCDCASLKMHLPAVIKQDWRSTWRWSIWRWSIWKWSIWRWAIWRWSIWRRLMGGVMGGETLFVSDLTRNHGIVTRWLYLWSSNGERAGGGQSV